MIANCNGGGDFTCLDTDAKSYWKCLNSQELSVAALCQLGQANFGGRYRFTLECGVLREPINCNTYKFTCFDKQQLLQSLSGSPGCVGDDCGRADPCGSSRSANQPYSMDCAGGASWQCADSNNPVTWSCGATTNSDTKIVAHCENLAIGPPQHRGPAMRPEFNQKYVLQYLLTSLLNTFFAAHMRAHILW